MNEKSTLEATVSQENAASSIFGGDELPPYLAAAASDSVAPTYTPYTKFPSIMNAYAGWNTKTFYISGAGSDKSNRLYCADYHMGYSSKGPLGSR